jgi:hypothetical protein
MLRVTTGEIHVLEGWRRIRKSVSFISMLLAFAALAQETHAAIPMNVSTARRASAALR